MTVRWEDPPDFGNGRGTPSPYRAALVELAKQPNDWAVVFEGTSVDAQNGRTAMLRIAPSLGLRIEAMVRTLNGNSRLYARVVE